MDFGITPSIIIKNEYKNYENLRKLTKWAGFIGVIQSIVWILLSITGILYYYDILTYSISVEPTYGMLINFMLYQFYFIGPNSNEGHTNGQIIIDKYFKITNENIGTTLSNENLNIWIWVYLLTSILWLLSSISLLCGISKNHLNRVSIFLHLWIYITIFIGAMDVGLAIIFGVDFNEFHTKSMKSFIIDDLKQYNNGPFLEALKISAIILMLVSIRGFILWLINIGFAVTFLKETFVISEHNVNQKKINKRTRYTSDTQSTVSRGPIQAYEKNNDSKNNKDESRLSTTDTLSKKINSDAIERASRMSTAVMYQKKINNFNSTFAQQYDEYSPASLWSDPRYPEPDYTPPMTRSTIFMNPSTEDKESERPKSALKNKRYF